MNMIYAFISLYLVPGLNGIFLLDYEERQTTTLIEFLLIIILTPWLILGYAVLEVLGIHFD